MLIDYFSTLRSIRHLRCGHYPGRHSHSVSIKVTDDVVRPAHANVVQLNHWLPEAVHGPVTSEDGIGVGGVARLVLVQCVSYRSQSEIGY